MARVYSDKFLRELAANKSSHLGVQLAKACVASNIPATYVAIALDSSRMTVYSWFRGSGMREDKRKMVESFLSILKIDTNEGLLPAKSAPLAKKYIEGVIGRPI